MAERDRIGAEGSDVKLRRAAVRTVAPFIVVGTLAILVGGGVAAAARPAGWDQGSWAAAYLVLPAGLGTWIGGLALGFLPADGRHGAVRGPLFLVAWALANGGVLAGNLLDVPVLLITGSVLLLGVLVVSALVLWRTSRHGTWLRAYAAGVVLLVVSVPIGLVLAAR